MKIIFKKVVSLEWTTYKASVALWALLFHKRSLGLETTFLETALNRMKFLDEIDSETKNKIAKELDGFDTLADIASICHSQAKVTNPSHFKLGDAVKNVNEEIYGGLYYKYYDSKETTLAAIKEPSIRFQYPENWNDIFESNHMVKNKGWEVLENKSIVGSCFSTKWDSLLMWSHYGESGKGFCVGYQIMESMFFDTSAAHESELWPVAYYQAAPVFPPMADALILTSKSIDWSYEEEQRLLIPNHIPAFYKIKPHAIREVIIGPKNESTSVLEICRNLKCESKWLKTYRAKKDPSRFGLIREEII